MEKYYRSLPEETDRLLEDISQHNIEVQQSIAMINDFIDNDSYNVIQNRLLPPTFYNDNIHNISSMVWRDIIQNTNRLTNIPKIKEDIDVLVGRLTIHSKGDNNNVLSIQHQNIGEGNYPNDSSIIKDVFINNVLKNEAILQKLVYIINSKLELESRINNISHHFHNLSNAIEINYYEEKVRCCPTILKAIRNYFF